MALELLDMSALYAATVLANSEPNNLDSAHWLTLLL